MLGTVPEEQQKPHLLGTYYVLGLSLKASHVKSIYLLNTCTARDPRGQPCGYFLASLAKKTMSTSWAPTVCQLACQGLYRVIIKAPVYRTPTVMALGQGFTDNTAHS